MLSIQRGGKEEEKGMFGLMDFVFPSHHYVGWGPVVLKMAEHLPDLGKQWISSLVFFALHFLLNCLYLNPS